MKQLLSLTLVLNLMIGGANLSVAGRLDGESLHQVTREFVTPHLDWGHSLVGGPIRVLFIANRFAGARAAVELAQRLDLNFEAVVTADISNFVVDNIYEASVEGTSKYEKTEELLEKLSGKFDVIVIANVNFSILPAEAQYRILKSVSEGTGLILGFPSDLPFPKLLENPTEDWRKIFAKVDIRTLPRQPQPGQENALLKTYVFGKGRIAIMPMADVGLSTNEPYTPGKWKGRFENSLALAGRVVQWAAGRKITADFTPEIMADKIRYALDPNGPSAVRIRIRDAENREQVNQQVFAKDQAVFEFDTSEFPAGQYYIDVLQGSLDSVSEFGVFGFEKVSPVGVLRVTTDKGSYESGEKLSATVSLEKPLAEDATIAITIEDLPDRRIWARQTLTLPKGTQEVKTQITDLHVPTIAARVVAEIQNGKKRIASTEALVYFPRRKLEIYPTMLWDNIPGSLSEMWAAHLRKNVPDAAGLTHPGEGGEHAHRSALFNQRFIPYVTRIYLMAGENGETLSKGWWLGMPTDEVEALSKDGSFHNPTARDFWKKVIAHRTAGLPEVGPMVYSLGDENNFSYEAGYSPSDGPAFTQFLKDNYPNIASLNKAWGSSYQNFEEIGHPSLKEMREKSLYPLWYAHRRFMERQYADVNHFLADEIRKHDPLALVGSEGSEPGNIEWTVKGLDFWGPYADPVNDEVLRSVAPEKLRTIWWGYGGHLAYPLWQGLLRGVINGNSWYTSMIEPISGLTSVDFSLQETYRTERKPHVDALNHGLAQLLVTTPLRSDGIAILWSHASYSASIMDSRFLNPRDSAIPLMISLYQLGLNFTALTSLQVEKGALANYRILWLPGATALSETESLAIEEFVKKGGIVVADVLSGILNESCGPLPKSRLGTLFGTPDLKGQAPLEIKEVSVDQTINGKKIVFNAKKARQSPEGSIFSINKSGKGLAILLNFSLGMAWNNAEGNPEQFLLSLLELANIRPAIQVEGIEKNDLIIRVRDNGENQVLGLLAAFSEIGKVATIRLLREAWVYEANKGLIGFGKSFESKLDVPFKIFSLFPTKQNPPLLSVSKKSLNLGEAVTLDGTGLSPRGLYRLEVYGPDGVLLPDFTKIFLGQPTGEDGVIRFALNDASGAYRLVLTDIRTGLSTTLPITTNPAQHAEHP